MQYKTVFAYSARGMDPAVKELEQKVNKLCEEGWKPQGGVSITIQDFDTYFACQAMVK